VSLAVFGLILVSATIHVGWNLLLKQTVHRQLTSWLAVLLAGVVPMWWVWPQTTAAMWGIAAISALFQGAYYLLLAYGYDHYDLGVLYPIARGVAPLLSAIWATIWLADSMRIGGIIAILMITGGTIWIGLRNRSASGQHQMPWLPLLVALAISGYTIIDAFGARTSGNPLIYYTACMLCTAVVMAPLTLWQNRQQLHLVWPTLPRAGIIGALSFTSYGMILVSYTSAPVSYVAATREISIVIAGIVGWLFLKEPLGSTRAIGAVWISLGVMLLVFVG
jgi:drug/metabolite transporter (DMT)-like permease